MKPNRSNSFLSRYLRASFTFVPGKPAYYRGLRVALIIGIPFFFGIQFNLLQEASIFVLAALNVALIDMGGLTYRRLSRTLLFTTLLNAAAAVVAILVGANMISAVLVTVIWLASVAMLGLLGHTGVMIALVNSVVFVIMVALPGDHTTVLRPFVIFLAGGFWAMLFSLMAWPISPYRPIRKAVARCYIENATFLRNLASLCKIEISDHLSSGEQKINDIIHRRFRESIDDAHEMLTNERKGRMGNNQVEDALISLLHSVAKDYRTMVTTMVWFNNEGKKVHISNSKLLSDFFIALADIHDEISNMIMHSSKSANELTERIASLKEKYLNSNEKIIVGQSKEIHHILEQTLTRFELEVVTAQRQHPSHKVTENNDHHESLIHDTNVSFSKLLKNNLLFASPSFRHAIRIGVTSALAVLIAQLMNLPHGYWLPLTVVVIMAPDYGGSFLVRSLQRGVGTTLGGLLAAFLLLHVHDEMLIFMFLLVFTILAISLLTINYALFVFFLTPLIVTMYSLSGNADWHISYDRVLDTIIGIALTLIAGRVFFPVWERNNYANRFSEMLNVIARYFNEILLEFEGDRVKSSAFPKLDREIELAAVVAGSSFQQALNQPGFNTKLIPYIMSFLNSSNIFIRGIISIHEYLEVNSTQVDDLDVVAKVGKKMVDLIDVLSKIILLQKSEEIRSDNKAVKLLMEMENMIKDIEKTYIDLANMPSFKKNVTTIEIKRLLEIVQNMVHEINSIVSVNMGFSADDDYLAE